MKEKTMIEIVIVKCEEQPETLPMTEEIKPKEAFNAFLNKRYNSNKRKRMSR